MNTILHLVSEQTMQNPRAACSEISSLAQPELLQRAVQTLERGIAQRQIDPPAALLEWRQILRERSLTEVLTLLRSDSEEAHRLRQSSPFCGILRPDERQAVFRQYETTRA